ncbi:hypothetical protein CONPUDRAFT_80627 [Coniophora puteana RWD-64-598 SS2]|uniref:Calcineurin-like phosphoesterase domain-containing protein n=1 Tax=Coniophora puteana (strain RWD-64-598) TaxID=741705 RepID=A0A5M3MZX9_CONPW|nr:uncharacterized protein CONPUDRAFT_80627 [Coniophora puteana RWD-64-598 SS2]EIW84205.1 hypothetical protein CONPUDRAFT_80627 [Coniophora puteana RWD-64-598 SS2]
MASLVGRNGTIHTTYDIVTPPPHPGKGWTRFVCISDTHSAEFPVPPGDVLLHSGDLSELGRKPELLKTLDWLSALSHSVKIIIAGNHDLSLHEGWYENNRKRFRRGSSLTQDDEDVAELRDIFRNRIRDDYGIVYLQDQSHAFRLSKDAREWTVYGSPWQPWFWDWAFNYEKDEAEDKVTKIPEVDILLTHGPPHKMLDTTTRGESAGCPELRCHLGSMQRPPLLHLFGHIHEGHGALVHDWSKDDKQLDKGNASSTNPNPRETLVVNAANAPMGKKSRTPDGERVPPGGPGFQPVIVDIRDNAHR